MQRLKLYTCTAPIRLIYIIIIVNVIMCNIRRLPCYLFIKHLNVKRENSMVLITQKLYIISLSIYCVFLLYIFWVPTAQSTLGPSTLLFCIRETAIRNVNKTLHVITIWIIFFLLKPQFIRKLLNYSYYWQIIQILKRKEKLNINS